MKILPHLLESAVAILITAVGLSCENGSKQVDLSVPKPAQTALQTSQQDHVVHEIDTSNAYLMGRFDPSEHEEFVLIDTVYADRPGLYLRKDTYQAFRDMWAAAQRDSVQLLIRSATRNFNYQKGIWERKWTGKTQLEGKIDATTIADYRERALAILRYSSMPGSSRHHWGTDIDLNSFSNQYFTKGQGQKEYDWLLEHAPSFGFCQPYTAIGPERPHGYQEEKWHWSYFPVSKVLTTAAAKHLEDQMIEGFAGSESATSIEVKRKYILGISGECF